MKKIFILLLLLAGISDRSYAQSAPFSFDSIWVPPYICQASHFDVEIFGTVADGSTQYGSESFLVSNDTIYARFNFISGSGPGAPYPLYRKINIPAPWTFGPYKIVAQGIYNGQIHQTLTSRIGICSSISGIGQQAEKTLSLIIYPNPAETYLQATLPFAGASAEISLTDISGKVIFTKKTPPNTPAITFNIKQLPPGYYLVHYRSETANLTRKFLKL